MVFVFPFLTYFTLYDTGRTGIKTQTQRMDLRTQGGARVIWDKGREWHGHTYTTKCKIAS